MKNRKLQTADELLAVAENNNGYLLLKDNYGKFWEVRQLKYVSEEALTETQACIHDWRNEDFNNELNCFLQRVCKKKDCGLKQRYQTSTGEWKNVWSPGERAKRKGDK